MNKWIARASERVVTLLIGAYPQNIRFAFHIFLRNNIGADKMRFICQVLKAAQQTKRTVKMSPLCFMLWITYFWALGYGCGVEVGP